MTHYVASDLGLHCLPMTILGVSRYEWDKVPFEQHASQDYYSAIFVKIVLYFIYFSVLEIVQST